jgi:hypothetical protein
MSREDALIVILRPGWSMLIQFGDPSDSLLLRLTDGDWFGHTRP